MRSRRWVWPVAVIAAAIVLAAGLAFALRDRAPAPPAIGGPFALLDGDSHTVTEQNFRGRWMLIYFGYTHCPDACPATLSNLAAAFDTMPAAERTKIVPVFVSVDPARDTPSVMRDYVRAFGPEFVGLTGDQTAVDRAAGEYHVFVRKYPAGRDGNYAVDHSSVVFVMRPDGGFAGVLNADAGPGQVVSQLRRLGA